MTKKLEDYKELNDWCNDNYSNHVGHGYHEEAVENKLLELAQQLEQANERVKQLERREINEDRRVMCNARRLIKAHKRTSNGRLCSELWGLGMGSGREYARKLGFDPDSNETPFN